MQPTSEEGAIAVIRSTFFFLRSYGGKHNTLIPLSIRYLTE